MSIDNIKKKKKDQIVWREDGSFFFPSGNRPIWTTAAKNIKVEKDQDRRHGLHGNDILTRACEELVNAELRKSSKEEVAEKIKINLMKRGVKIRDSSFEGLVQLLRKLCFSKVDNLLPGDSHYNRAINQIKERSEKVQKKLELEFFSHGEMPNEVDLEKYRRRCLSLLKPAAASSTPGKIKMIVDSAIQEIAIPMIKQASNLEEITQAIFSMRDSGRIDIAFSNLNQSKKFNKSILKWDTLIKRFIVSNDGLSQHVFNLFVGKKNSTKKKNKTGKV